MSINITYGVLFLAISILAFVAFIFNNRALKKLSVLDGVSRFAAITIAIVTLGSTFVFGWFSWQNFSYRAPKTDELTAQLKTQIEEVKKSTGKYTQRISSEDYFNLKPDELYNFYSEEGKQDVDNLAKQSELTRNLFLRNVGRQIKAGDIFTTSLKATNGKSIDLLDGNQRVLLFVDNTEYSVSVIAAMRDYIASSKSEVELVYIFPVNSGIDIDNFFTQYNDKVGAQESSLVVSSDSISNMSNLNVRYLTIDEYQVENLPSYIAIDGQSVVSNAGVGTLIESQEDAKSWFNKAFTAETKYYDRIEKKSAKDSEEAGTSTDEGSTESASNAGPETSTESNTGGE